MAIMIQCHHGRRRRVVVPVTTSLLVSLLLSLLTIGGLPRHDVHAAAAVNYNNNDDELLLLSNIKCSSGWTASAAATVKNEAIPSYIPKSWINSKIPRIPYYIPQSWINDGYCDCPFGNENGMTDEPNTNACSGSKSWPGVGMGSIISTSDLPEIITTDDVYYICPEQSKLILPLSRIQDGICDCCDGSDEDQYTICPNNCDELLKEEREKEAKIKHAYLVGSRQRDLDIQTFQIVRTQKLLNIENNLKPQIVELELDISNILNLINDSKQQYVQSRIITMKDSVVAHQLSTELLSGLLMSSTSTSSTNKLETFIIHLCQISGELMMSSNDDDEFSNKIPNDDLHRNSCTPLRVAALDIGLTWNVIEDFNDNNNNSNDNNDTGNGNGINGQVNMTGEMIQIIYENAIDTAAAISNDNDNDNDDDDDTENKAAVSLFSIPLLRWTNTKTKTKKTQRKGGRRLDEDSHYDDDFMMDEEYERDNMMMDDDDDLYNDQHDRDDFDYDDSSSSSRGWKDNEDDEDNGNEDIDNDATTTTVDVDDEMTSKEDEFLNDLSKNQLRLFSKITQRLNYLQESEKMIQKLNQILDSPPTIDVDIDEEKKENDNDNNNNVVEEEEEEAGTTREGEDEKNTVKIEDDDNDTADVVLDDETTAIADDETNVATATTTEDDDDNDNDENSNRSKSSFDPTSYTMVRNKLRQKQQIIQKGLRWGASAKLLFDDSKNISFSNEDLKRLAIGTLFYGQISSLQVWQILISILESASNNNNSSVDDDDDADNHDRMLNTCSSPWSEYCPPNQTVLKYGKDNDNDDEELELESILYPPSFLMDVAKVFCEEEGIKFAAGGSSTSAASCGNNNNNNNNDDVGDKNDNDKENIATFVSKYNNNDDDDKKEENEESFLHNFGYTVPVRRNPDGSDPLQSIFKSIIELPIDVDGLYQLEESKKSKEDEIKDINKSINDTWKEIGGIDGNELGRDGEIWTIADKCFDITAGKYTYEVCLFGKALQKEGSDKGGGTNLGQWTGIEYEKDDNDNGDDSSIRVMKWENGAKCWNGPKRSATVYMKCGIEHKIISANEPDTCRYVFEMESYLACDDSYKLRAGL